MLSDQRRAEMAEWICREGKADITELAEYFQVSGETVRRDLNVIADGKKIRKVHGGAIAPRPPVRDESYAERLVHNSYHKKKIGEYAVRFLENNDVIAIDAGTNAECFAESIYHIQNLKIITYSLPVASILSRKLTAGDFTGSVILTGGKLNPETQTVYGAEALSELQRYRVNKAFLSATAVDETGVMSWTEDDGLLTAALLSHADRAYVLAESDKLDRQSFFRIASFQGINALITDGKQPASDALKKALKESSAELCIADRAGEAGEEKQ